MLFGGLAGRVIAICSTGRSLLLGAAAAPVVGLFGDARIGTTLGVLSIVVVAASLAALSLVRARDAPPAREAR